MGISKPSQGCVKHQKDMAVLSCRVKHQKDMAVLSFGLLSGDFGYVGVSLRIQGTLDKQSPF